MADLTEVKSPKSPVSADQIYIATGPPPPQNNQGLQWVPRSWRKEIEADQKAFIRSLAGEALVSFLFFFSVLAISVNNVRSAAPENLAMSGISTAFVAISYIYAFADVSGAHFNPNVTFGLMVTGNLSTIKGLAYIVIQCFACTAATLFCMVVFPGTKTGGVSTIPSALALDVGTGVSIMNAFFAEFIIAFILSYIVHATAVDKTEARPIRVESTPGSNVVVYASSGASKNDFAPMVIGLTHGFLVMLAGSVSGSAFNPARAFGPALLTNAHWANHWIYWVPALLGAGLGGVTQYVFAHKPKSLFK